MTLPISMSAAEPQTSNSERFVPLLVIGACVFLWLAIALMSLNLAGTSLRSLLIIADATVLLLPMIYKASLGTLDIFEPLVVTNAALAGMMIGRPLADIIRGHFIEHGYDISPAFDQTLAVVLLGNLCLQIAYLSPLRRIVASWLPSPGRKYDVSRSAAWAGILAACGLIFYSAFILSQGGIRYLLVLLAGRSRAASAGHWNASGYLYGTIGLLVPAAIILFGNWVMVRRPIYLAGAILAGMPQLLISSAQGARSSMIGLLFSAPMIWYLAKGRRPSPVRILVSVGVLMAVFGFMRTHRNAGTQDLAPQEKFDPVVSALSIFQSDDDEMFDVTALEVLDVPRFIQFHPFGVITDIIIRAIPRQIYPEKRVDISTDFFQFMWPARAYATHARGGTATSLVGDFFLDYGVVTVCFWMFVLGLLLSGIWEWYLSNHTSPSALLIYCVAPSVIVGLMRGSFAGTIASGLFTVFPLLLLPWINRFRVRQ